MSIYYSLNQIPHIQTVKIILIKLNYVKFVKKKEQNSLLKL